MIPSIWSDFWYQFNSNYLVIKMSGASREMLRIGILKEIILFKKNTNLIINHRSDF